VGNKKDFTKEVSRVMFEIGDRVFYRTMDEKHPGTVIEKHYSSSIYSPTYRVDLDLDVDVDIDEYGSTLLIYEMCLELIYNGPDITLDEDVWEL